MSDYKKWEVAQVREWIKDQKFRPNVEQHVINTLGAYGGDILDDITSKEDLRDLGVIRVYHSAIWRAIQKLKEETGANTQQTFEEMMMENEEQNAARNVSEFYVMFDASSSRLHKSRKKFKLTDTLLELKQYWVDYEEGGNISHLVLIFNSKLYGSDNNAKTLKEIGMTAQNNVVSTLWKMTGGPSAPDVEQIKHGQTGKKTSYYNVGGGLNYGGKCLNKNCGAYKQNVICKRGFGEKIDPCDDIIEEKIKCPGCSHVFDLKEYFLFSCDCKIIYKKKGESLKNASHCPRDEDYVQLGINEAVGSVSGDYEYLKFNVYKPGEMPKDNDNNDYYNCTLM